MAPGPPCVSSPGGTSLPAALAQVAAVAQLGAHLSARPLQRLPLLWSSRARASPASTRLSGARLPLPESSAAVQLPAHALLCSHGMFLRPARAPWLAPMRAHLPALRSLHGHRALPCWQPNSLLGRAPPLLPLLAVTGSGS
uniref:Uncharacterized protein n=1 Tax=Zea mays TaxID=4577 RepID=A0A804R2S5_MAIZE